MLNRKFADLRHSPKLDPRVLSYDAAALPQDLKLDLLICADGKASWLDQEDYERELEAGTIQPAWQKSVSDTVAALDRERAAGAFPPEAIRCFSPSLGVRS